MTAVVDSTGRRLSTADRIALATAVTLFALIAVRFRNYQWDFYMFCGSADNFRHGVSPYRGAGLSFYHPPLTLYLYGLFLHLPFPIAYELWLALKLAALAVLFRAWHTSFARLELTWSTILYFILAYNGTIYSDLVAGNVSTFEQVGLWLGFVALLEGRYAWFAVSVALVAQFKLTPIFFSILLLLAPKRPQWKWFAACCAGFIVVFSMNYVFEPALFKDFFTVAPVLDERGTLAPGTLAFARDVVDRLGGPNFSNRTHIDELIFLIISLGVGLVSLVTVIRHRRASSEPNMRVIIYLACSAYAVMAPRMRAYAYILLLVPTLHLLRSLPARHLVPVAGAAVAAAVMIPLGSSLLPFRSLSQLAYEYVPLLAAVAVWFEFNGALGRDATSANDDRASSTAAATT